MIAAQCSHPLLSPVIAATGTQAIAIENTGNQPVGAHAREHPHGLNCFFRCLSHVLTASAPRDAYLGVDAALPVDHQHDFTRRRIYIDDNFVNESARDALLQPHVRIRLMPYRLEFGGEVGKIFYPGRRYVADREGVLFDTPFDVAHTL